MADVQSSINTLTYWPLTKSPLGKTTTVFRPSRPDICSVDFFEIFSTNTFTVLPICPRSIEGLFSESEIGFAGACLRGCHGTFRIAARGFLSAQLVYLYSMFALNGIDHRGALYCESQVVQSVCA